MLRVRLWVREVLMVMMMMMTVMMACLLLCRCGFDFECEMAWGSGA
jgi:hypothetical protein